MQTHNLKEIPKLLGQTNFCFSSRPSKREVKFIRKFNLEGQNFINVATNKKERIKTDDKAINFLVQTIQDAYLKRINEQYKLIKDFSLIMYGHIPFYPENETSTLVQKITNLLIKTNLTAKQIKEKISEHLECVPNFYVNKRFIPLDRIERAYFQCLNKESKYEVEKTLYRL